MKAKEKLNFDDSIAVVGPSCGGDVHVGTTRPAGLEQYEGKGPCHKAEAKKNQQKRTRTLFNISLKKARDVLLKISLFVANS